MACLTSLYQGPPEMNLQKWSIQCIIFLTKQLVYLLYKDEKPSVCLSVGTFWHALSFAVSPRIRAKFAQNEAPIIGEHGVSF